MSARVASCFFFLMPFKIGNGWVLHRLHKHLTVRTLTFHLPRWKATKQNKTEKKQEKNKCTPAPSAVCAGGTAKHGCKRWQQKVSAVVCDARFKDNNCLPVVRLWIIHNPHVLRALRLFGWDGPLKLRHRQRLGLVTSFHQRGVQTSVRSFSPANTGLSVSSLERQPSVRVLGKSKWKSAKSKNEKQLKSWVELIRSPATSLITSCFYWVPNKLASVGPFSLQIPGMFVMWWKSQSTSS